MTKISTVNPATEETIATYDLTDADTAFKKIEACHAAFLEWRKKTHDERGPYLRDIAKALREKSDEFATLMTQETGKLFRDGKTEIELYARILEYTAENGPTELADEERTHSDGKKRSIVAFSPIGVVYTIQPWNFPIYQPVRVLAANLMAGNTILLKHAAICTGSGLILRKVCAEAVYEKFISAFVDQMKAINMGDPMKEETQLGPVASKEQFDRLSEQVTKSIAGGAKLLCGGNPPDRMGHYYPPTVLANCQPGTPAYDDELFGPVASVIKAKDDADAMRIANDSRYGLGGGIFTRDEDKAVKLARNHFDTGMVHINSFDAVVDPNMPFGGVKDSGFGREHGGFGMKEFVNAKAIFLP